MGQQVCCYKEVLIGDLGSKDDDRRRLVNSNATYDDDEVFRQNMNTNLNNSSEPSTSENVIHDMDVLLEAFEDSVNAKDYENAMAFIEEYSNADFINHEFANGDRVLHYAIGQSSSKFAYFILQKGADPNMKSKATGDTPLHIATRNEDVRMITLLMKWKASVEVKNYADKSPYDIACDQDNPDIIDMYDATFQNFIQSKNPTVKDYTPRAKSDVYKNKGATDAAKVKKNRKVWQPTTDTILEPPHEPERSFTPSPQPPQVTPQPAYNSAKSPEPYGVFSDEEMGRAGDDYTGDARSERSMTEFDDDFNHDLSISSVSATEYVDYEETKKNLQDWDIGTLLKDVGVTNNNNNNNNNNNGPGQLTLKKKMSQKVISSLGTVMQVENEEEKLPVLASWMEKRRPKPPYMYQKRFVCVIDGHLLWNDKKVKVRPGQRMDSTERKKFGGSLSLMMIKNVVSHDSKKKNYWKFKLVLRENAVVNKKKGKKSKIQDKSDRVYIWKCYSKETRNEWVTGLTAHLKHLKRTLKRLDQLDTNHTIY